MKHIVFMTSCVAHEYCIELHKKYLEMVNFTASLPDYKVTLVIPQKKTNKYYSENSNILTISPKVNVVRIYKTMIEDGKGGYDASIYDSSVKVLLKDEVIR